MSFNVNTKYRMYRTEGDIDRSNALFLECSWLFKARKICVIELENASGQCHTELEEMLFNLDF